MQPASTDAGRQHPAGGDDQGAARRGPAAAVGQAEQDQHVDPDPGGGGEREALHPQRSRQHHLQADIDRDRGERGDDRRAAVLAGVEARHDAADEQLPPAAPARRPPGPRRSGPAASASKAPRWNSAVMIRSGTSRNATANGARGRARSRWRGSAPACARPGRRGDAPAHLRQQHRTGGDADHHEGQLVEPVGVVERRDRAGRQERGDDRVGEHRDLHAGRADHRRSQHPEEPALPASRRVGRTSDGASRPARIAQTSRNCSTPTPRRPRRRRCRHSEQKARASAASSETLSSTGAAAAAAKRRRAFRMPTAASPG